MKQKKVLIITSSGGNGLLQAAQAKEDEVLLKDPDAIIIKKDALMQWMGNSFGSFARHLWNSAQKKGNVLSQVFFLKTQFIVEYFSTPILFICMFRLLMKEDVDRVIDTQVFCTAYFVKAIRLYNWLRKKNLVLEKVMIDLPTKKAGHFFGPIRRCTKKDKQYLKFVTVEPLLQGYKNEEEFWKKSCKLPLKNIVYEPFIVRKCFRKYENLKKCTQKMDLEFCFFSNEEKELMQSIFSKGLIHYTQANDHFNFHIEPDEFVITILLGSQPSYLGSFGYVKKMIEFSRKFDRKTHLFIFCADFDKKKNSLFVDLCKYINSVEDFPKNLSIIPFSYQTQNKIAPLIYRSNQTITRAGGGTAMELLAVMRGEIFIHTENFKKNASKKQLLGGIPGHESGAAEYLEQKREAKIVNPELFYSYITDHSLARK